MTNDDAPTQRVQTEGVPTRGGFAAGQRVFARYLLEAQVGRGGMGVVWRARDEKLDRPVALKFLPPEVAADVEAVRDLKLETRRCLDLTHNNIVRVYDFIEEEMVAAIAMEYIEGESLSKIKASAPGGCLAAGDLTPFVAQLCAALRYAHLVAKVAHHDLKPANVLVTKDGVLKVTDFGIARSLTDTQSRMTGRVGSTSGTLHYMSPQQMTGEKPTAADDIYALGALLYELLTGKPPFFRGDAFTVRQQVLERAPGPLEAHRRDVGCTGPEIPPSWSETILACLAKKPEDRPKSADDVATRLGISLEPLATSSTGLASGLTAGRTMAAPPAAPARRSLVPWLIGIGSLLLAATGSWVYFGVYVPEQARLAAAAEHARAEAERARAEAERARQAELALQMERVRQAEEQRKAAEVQALEERKKEEAARVQAVKDQQNYSAMLAKIAELTDPTRTMQVNETGRAVRDYVKFAPSPFNQLVQKAWTDRQAAWRAAALASQPGTLVVETDPAGASVVLYPKNEHKTSPAVFEQIKPGDVNLHVEKEGYEAKDVPWVVKPGVTTKVDVVTLVAIYGSLAITSAPADLYVLLEGPGGRRLEGRTPFNPTLLPPGEYKLTFQRGNRWRPQVRTATVERGKPTRVFADLKGYDVAFQSTPPGAQLTVDGSPIGIAPVSILGIEPCDHRVVAALDGYDTLVKTFTVAHADTVALALTEKSLPHALRRLAGQRWHYDSFSLTAELWFTIQGRITGSHRSTLGNQVRDVGTADAFNANTNVMNTHFVGNTAKSIYVGNVQMKLVDDDHLAVSWTAGGSAERLIFERDKAIK